MSIKIEDSWKHLLDEEFNKDYFKQLISFVKSEYSSYICYPKGSQIFSAFDNCPINELKVVIIGQDPYHGEGQANGMAFSVARGVGIPPSLKNICKELISEGFMTEAPHGDLTHWVEQGVQTDPVLTVKSCFEHSGNLWLNRLDKICHYNRH